MEERECVNHGKLPLDQFYMVETANRHGNGQKTRYMCKICAKARRKAQYSADPSASAKSVCIWRKENPERSKEIQRTYWKNHPAKYESLKKRRKEERLNIRIQVLKHYSNGTLKCMCPGCIEAHLEFLCIDHIDGGGTKHRTEIKTPGSHFYAWLVQNGLPIGYRVLCHNCNFSYGAFKYCPHMREGSTGIPVDPSIG